MKDCRCLTVATALLTLVALKVYIEWSAEQGDRYPVPRDFWQSHSTIPVQLFETKTAAFIFQHFNASLKKLRQNIPRAKAYWNEKQYKNFQVLEDGLLGNASWDQCSSPITAKQVNTIKGFNTYSELYKNFILYGDCRRFSLLINQPNKCSNSQNRTFLLLAIKSLPRNFAARQAVRDTWGQEGEPDGLPVRTIFLLGNGHGRYGPRLQRLIFFESQSFGDILMWDFDDTFFNLTLKDFLFLSWTKEYCRHVRFILKGDDDVFVNTPRVLSYLSTLEANKTIYLGQVVANASPFRVHNSKYYVPESFYVGPYPAYAGGGGYIFSGALAHLLHLVSQYIAFYPIDDVYTGLCFQALGIFPEAHPGFLTFDIAVKDREDPCVHSKLLLVHQRSPQQTLYLWRKITDPNLKC